MPEQEQRTRIYERVARHGRPYRFAEPWGFLPPADGAFAGLADPEAALGELAREFDAAALVDAGVVRRSDNGDLALRAELTDSGGFLVLEDAEKGPYEILGSRGCLSGSGPAVFAAPRDRQTAARIGACDNVLLATFSIAEAVVLRAMGLPATVAAGLDSVPLDRLDEFCSTFGLSRYAEAGGNGRDDEDPDGDEDSEGEGPFEPNDLVSRWRSSVARNAASAAAGGPPPGQTGETDVPRGGNDRAQGPAFQLVLVRWSPTRLSLAEPDGLRPVADYFEQLGRYLDIDLLEVLLWRPAETDVDRLRFLVEHRAETLAREAMLRSLRQCSATLLACARLRRRALQAPKNFPSALAHLLSVLRENGRSADPSRQHDAWRAYERELDGLAVHPLLSEAAATGDLVDRHMFLLLATTSRLFHVLGAATLAKFANNIDQARFAPGDVVPIPELKQLLALADQIVRASREVRRWTPQRWTQIPDFAPLMRTNYPALADSG